MTTIKMDKDTVTTAVTNFESRVEIYRAATVSSIARFSNFQGVLEGEAYEALISSINNALDTQKQLVAECIVLTDDTKKFVEEISSQESSASFG